MKINREKHEAISEERAKELIDYNPKSGEFRWKAFRGGSAQADTRAGSINARGYLVICIDCNHILAHRLAWLFLTGEWPRKFVDHANGVKTDNRAVNLREADNARNIQNSKLRVDNKSGVKGVSYSKSSGSWVGYVSVYGKQHYIKSSINKNKVIDAVRETRKKLHQQFAREV